MKRLREIIESEKGPPFSVQYKDQHGEPIYKDAVTTHFSFYAKNLDHAHKIAKHQQKFLGAHSYDISYIPSAADKKFMHGPIRKRHLKYLDE